jgi:hypothetical protein
MTLGPGSQGMTLGPGSQGTSRFLWLLGRTGFLSVSGYGIVRAMNGHTEKGTNIVK